MLGKARLQRNLLKRITGLGSSLIGIRKNVKDIVIPSEEMKIDVNPMDFEEFCWAVRWNYQIFKQVALLKKGIGDAVNRKPMRCFRI